MTAKTGYALVQNQDAIAVSRSGTSRQLTINDKPIEVAKGFDTEVSFFIHDEDRLPVNISNSIVSATLVERNSVTPIWSRELIASDPANGQAHLYIKARDIKSLEDDVYFILLSMVTEAGNRVLLYSDTRHQSRFVVNIYGDSNIELAETETVTMFSAVSGSEDEFLSSRIASTSQNPESHGLQTAAIYTTDFTGTVTIEASLTLTPDDDSWFVVDDPTGVGTISLTDESGITPISFDGRFSWVRFRYTVSSGTLDKILYRS